MRFAKGLTGEVDGRLCVSIEDAARHKKISAWALRKRIKQGHIEVVESYGKKVVPLDALEKFHPDRAKSERARKNPPGSRQGRPKSKPKNRAREEAMAS